MPNASGCRIIHFNFKRFANDCNCFARIVPVFRFMRIGDMMNQVGEQETPGGTLIYSSFFPKANVKYAMLLLVC